MKHFKFIFVFFLVSIALQSCDSSDDSNDAPPAGTLQVSFDNQTLVADLVSSTILDDVINVMGIRGSEGEMISITLFGSTPGTYQLGVATENPLQINSVSYIEPNNTGSGVFVSRVDDITSQGEVIITEIDNVNMTISGTFNFTGTNGSTQEVKEFTNGSFVEVSYNDGLVANDNTFFAKVDGTEFVEDVVAGTRITLGGSTTLSISATKNSQETIGLSFDGDIAVGTYDFGGFGGVPLAQYNTPGSNDVNLGDGTFTITEHDIANKHIVGTFEFIATSFLGGDSSYEITEGSFDVIYL